MGAVRSIFNRGREPVVPSDPVATPSPASQPSPPSRTSIYVRGSLSRPIRVDNEDYTCPICSRFVKIAQPTVRCVVAPNRHIFHKACLADWQKMHGEQNPGAILRGLSEHEAPCPNCRAPIPHIAGASPVIEGFSPDVDVPSPELPHPGGFQELVSSPDSYSADGSPIEGAWRAIYGVLGRMDSPAGAVQRRIQFPRRSPQDPPSPPGSNLELRF